MPRITLFLLLAALGLPAWAASGVMLRDDSLRATASATATSRGQARKGNKVEVLARQGGWTQVRAAGKTGWVRLLSVRTVTSVGGLGDVGTLTAQRDPDKVVATAGLRGLNEEELRRAQYDAQEMQRLDGQAVNAEEARRHAAEGQLSAIRLDYLPAPQVQASPASPTGGFEF